MKTQHAITIGLAVCWAATAVRAALPVEDGFETYPLGHTFVTPTNDGWQSDRDTAVVTNDPAHRRGTQSAVLIDAVRLTNSVAATAPKVWTDAWVEPCLGGPPLEGVTNNAMHVQYFDTNGYLRVATTSGWYTCSNDVWGGALAAVTNSRFVHVALFQDYGRSNWALFVDGRLVLQEQPFAPPPGGYRRFVVRNADGRAWLDDVWIKTNYNAAILTNSLNVDPMADAEEVERFGHTAQILYVGSGPGQPLYPTLQEALDVWRPRDVLHMYGGIYSGDVVVTQDLVFIGEAFTNNGTLTVAAAASASFAQSATWAAASVTGTVAVAGGGALVVQSNLAVGAGGLLSFSNGTLAAVAQGLTMRGTFTVDSAWGTLATIPLEFRDDFELYAADTRLQDVGFLGWGASRSGVVVRAGAGYGPSQGTEIPADSSLSNRVDRGAAVRVWTDLRLRMQPGQAPLNARTNDATFLCYVDTNRHLAVSTPSGWVICSNYWNGAEATVDTQSYARVTVHQDFTQFKFAVFLDGRLLRDSLTFPGGAKNSYKTLRIENSAEAAAYADDVLIVTNVPFALGYPAAGADQDGDGWLDAVEIDRYGHLSNGPPGTTFKFR